MSQIHLLREKKYLWAPFWGVLFFICMMGVSTYFVLVHVNQQAYDYDLNGDIIREFSDAKKKTDLSVVMLGNSRLRNATSMGYDPDQIYKLPDGRTVTVLQFAYNMGRFNNYTDLVVPLLQARPDVIVIQDGMMTNLLKDPFSLSVFAQMVVEYYGVKIDGTTIPQAWNDTRSKPVPCPPRQYDRSEMNGYLAFMDRYHHTIGAANPGYMAAQSFIDNALRLGIKIVVLRMKPKTAFFERMGVPVYESNFHGLGRWPSHEELVPNHYNDVTWLSYEETNPENFCDWIHLNDKGAVLFTDWLLQNLQTIAPAQKTTHGK